MDVFDIRQQRVRELVQEVGSQTALAGLLVKRGMKIAPNYISRVLSDGKYRKRVSEEYAAEIEIAANKPPGWLSHEDNGPKITKLPKARWPFSIDQSRYDQLPASDRQEVDQWLTRQIELHEGQHHQTGSRLRRAQR